MTRPPRFPMALERVHAKPRGRAAAAGTELLRPQRPLHHAAEQAARLIADEASRLYDAMHGLIPRLAPMVLDTLGLGAALADLAERTRRSQPGLQIDLTVALDGVELSADVALALYRSAQEGITNALRHGQAHHLVLRLAAAAGTVTLDLRDDGRGLPQHRATSAGTAVALGGKNGNNGHASDGGDSGDGGDGGHYGLRWLAERAQGLGGQLRLGAAQPHGAQLHLSLPTRAVAPGQPGDRA